MKRNDFTTLAFLLWIIILTCVIAIYDGNLKEERRKVVLYVTIVGNEKRLRRELEKLPVYKMIGVAMTAYSPDKAQCQGNPFETASGLIVNQQDLRELKYIAISRDLKKKYNLHWGDSIYVEFFVVDLMGEKAQGKVTENTIDWFMENKKAALQFGNQKDRNIIILKGGSDGF